MTVLKTPLTIHPRYAEAMSYIAPGSSPLRDYTLRDMGDGAKLYEWNLPGDPPTDDQIVTALVQVDWNTVRAIRVPLLDNSDTIALRCFKAGVSFPADWQVYTKALRDITKQADPLQVEWPAAPAVPSGT